MAATIKYGDTKWAVKDGNTLGYNDENRFKPVPFDFTRNSIGTRVDRNGLIETIGNNIPRIDFTDNTDGHLLLEPQSTNLLPYSEDFTQSNWTNFQSATTSNQNNSLTNDNNATLFYPLVSSTYASLFDTANLSLGIYTFSVFAKASGKDFLCIDDGNGGQNWFNLGDGTLGTINSSYTANIQDFGNEWYRCSITNNSNSTFNYRVIYLVTDADNSTTITKNGTDGILLFGSQVEALSHPTSYIPTNGSTITRASETCTNAGNSTLINSTEGVLYAEIAALETTSSGSNYITITDGTYNNRASILFSSGATNQIRFFLRVGGASQVDKNQSVTNVKSFNKVAFKYKANDFAVWINGVEVSTDTSGSVWTSGTINELTFTEIGTTTGAFRGKLKAVAVFNEALSDSELTQLTT